MRAPRSNGAALKHHLLIAVLRCSVDRRLKKKLRQRAKQKVRKAAMRLLLAFGTTHRHKSQNCPG